LVLLSSLSSLYKAGSIVFRASTLGAVLILTLPWETAAIRGAMPATIFLTAKAFVPVLVGRIRLRALRSDLVSFLIPKPPLVFTGTYSSLAIFPILEIAAVAPLSVLKGLPDAVLIILPGRDGVLGVGALAASFWIVLRLLSTTFTFFSSFIFLRAGASFLAGRFLGKPVSLSETMIASPSGVVMGPTSTSSTGTISSSIASSGATAASSAAVASSLALAVTFSGVSSIALSTSSAKFSLAKSCVDKAASLSSSGVATARPVVFSGPPVMIASASICCCITRSCSSNLLRSNSF